MYHIKKDKRSIQSSKWLYSALSELMREKKYKDIKVTEIVKQAKLGRATFYRNFDCKDDVLKFKCDKTFDGLLDYLIKYHKNSPVKHSFEFIKPFLYFFDEHALIVKQLINANRQDMLSDSLIKLLETFQPQYKKLVKYPEKTWDYFIAIRCGITINILVQWVKNDKNLSPDELSVLLMQQSKNRFTVQQFL